MSILNPLYDAVAHAVVGIHSGLEPVFGKTNGYGWALSIVLLTLGVRILLFPLFVKQIKSQRTMQLMQPKMKEIREKYKNDKQRMNQELMALQKEHGNPLLGCLPIFAQIPLFIALFRVLTSITPKLVNGKYQFVASHGLTVDQVRQMGSAKVFGVPLSGALRSNADVLKFLGAHNTALVKVVAAVFILLMVATTYFTQRQIQGRNPAPTDPQQRMQMKLMLYLAPGMLLISGYLYPIGVLCYWLTTNLWSLGQQFFVLRKMPPVMLPTTTGAERAVAREKASTTPDRSTKPLRATRTKTVEPKEPVGALAQVRRSRPDDVPADHETSRPRLDPPSGSSPSGATGSPGGPGSPSRPGVNNRPRKNKGGKGRKGGRR